MKTITYSDARASLKDVMDSAIYDLEEVVITRRNREAVIVVSLEEYNSIQETLHLQKSPRNARRLRESIAELDAGKGKERDLPL